MKNIKTICSATTIAKTDRRDEGKWRQCELTSRHAGDHMTTYCGQKYYWPNTTNSVGIKFYLQCLLKSLMLNMLSFVLIVGLLSTNELMQHWVLWTVLYIIMITLGSTLIYIDKSNTL
jgi:hypothetical protein